MVVSAKDRARTCCSRGQVLAARGDVVVVTVNYRLGALGFLTHPDLADDEGVCGNWGVLDLITALRWVRDEIGAFGGDATNVTLFGESAGGTLVALLAATAAARRFVPPRHRAERRADGDAAPRASRLAEELAEEVGVGSVRELRDTAGDAILAGQLALEARRGGGMVFMPSVDGELIERAPVDALGSGAAAGIPMMIGTNVDEMRLLAAGDPHRTDLDDDGLRRRLDKVLDGGVDDVIETVRRAREGRGEPATPSDLWFAIDSDRFFRVPSLRAADAHVAHEPRTFVYLFGWPSPALDGWLGACHVLEIPFVFGLQGAPDFVALTGSGPAADRLSEQMMGAWTAFARTDDPSTAELPWPQHDVATRPTMYFDERSRVEMAPARPNAPSSPRTRGSYEGLRAEVVTSRATCAESRYSSIRAMRSPSTTATMQAGSSTALPFAPVARSTCCWTKPVGVGWQMTSP